MQWDFEIKYKKGIEMPADYLSRNVVEAIDMSNEDLVEMQNQDKFCVSLKHLLQKFPVEKEHSKLVPQMTELSHICFIEDGVLWKRITRHHGQHTVIEVPKALIERILSEVHGNVLYDHEGKYKTKERIIQSYLIGKGCKWFGPWTFKQIWVILFLTLLGKFDHSDSRQQNYYTPNNQQTIQKQSSLNQNQFIIFDEIGEMASQMM
jgi:hypothetical protein